MKIAYDQNTRKATVAFRGKLTVLPNEFCSEAEATRAAEKYCEGQGWVREPAKDSARSILRQRKPW
jgi:hypothetical protein